MCLYSREKESAGGAALRGREWRAYYIYLMRVVVGEEVVNEWEGEALVTVGEGNSVQS